MAVAPVDACNQVANTQRQRCWISKVFILSSMTVFFLGCQSESPVAGVVLVDERPLTCSGSQSCKLAFYNANSDLSPVTVSVDSSGSFKAPDLPIGTYRVVVNCFERYPFNDKFAKYFRDDPEAIEVEVVPQLPVEIRIPSDWLKKKRP